MHSNARTRSLARRMLAGLLLLPASAALHAQVFITSVVDGPWHSPATWDCGCVPANDDNVQVEHAVVITQDAELGFGLLNVTADGSITGGSGITLTLYSAFSNSGRIAVDRFLLMPGGAIDYAFNADSLQVGSMCFMARPDLVNGGVIQVLDTLRSGALWENAAGGIVRATYLDGNAQVLNLGTIEGVGSFLTPFDNRGTITHQGPMFQQGSSVNTGLLELQGDLTVMSGFEQAGRLNMQGLLQVNGTCTIAPDTALVDLVGDLLVNGTLTGSGVLCVTNNTANFGLISGTLDLCDITRTDSLPPYLDVNEGTVAGTVIFCDNPYCSPQGAGIRDRALRTLVVAYPNPAHDVVRIAPLEDARTVSAVLLHDALGRWKPVHWQWENAGIRITLDASPSGPGMFVLVDSQGNVIARVPVVLLAEGDQRR